MSAGVTPARVRLAGIEIDNLSMAETLARVEALSASDEPSYVVTPNVDHLVKLQRDEEFRRIYKDAALVLADGVPLLWASRLLGQPLKEKVSGSDLFVEVCALAAERSLRVFLLGGRPGAAQMAADRLVKDHPGLEVCGIYCPYFGFERDEAENARIVQAIRGARPNILFVGLGAPKQERWIHRHREALGVPVSIGVGISFEFVAGLVRRAPRWMQRVGLEWSWRLLMEPRRLWRRYLLEDPKFLYYVARHALVDRTTSRVG